MSGPQQNASSLRVVAADETDERLQRIVDLVHRAGYEVVAAETDLKRVRAVIEDRGATLAIVAAHGEPTHALALIETINDTAGCPVILLLDEADPAVVREALERGLDAYATNHSVAALESAVALARRRFAELGDLGRQVRDLEAGADRRALIERAKGVLMERHDIDERAAYERLRTQARSTRSSLVEVARSVLSARGLLPSREPGEPGPPAG